MIVQTVILLLSLSLGSCQVLKDPVSKFQYQIWIWTGEEDYAGTDASVYVQIFGSERSTDEILLDSNGDNFEKGSLNIFTIVEEKSLGRILYMKVRHNNKYVNPGWLIDEVRILRPSGDFVTFPCKTWLDKSVGDGKIERTLYPKITEYCGVRGGAPAFSTTGAKNSWPWQAIIKYRFDYLNGGVLLQPQWVLTTANLVEKSTNGSDFFIILGEHRLDKDEDEEQHFTASRIVVHPEYNKTTLANNLALIKLSRPVQFSHAVNIPCLPPQDYELLSGHQCYRSGFRPHCTDSSTKTYLQEDKMLNLPKKYCANEARQTQGSIAFDKDTMLCTLKEKPSDCFGLQGDPLVCPSIESKLYLQGVSTWTKTACPKCESTHFVRVSSYINWIESVIFVE